MILIEEWVKENPERTVIGVLAATIIVPVLMSLLYTPSGDSDSAYLDVIHISSLSPAYANNRYSDVQVAVYNGGDVTAEECYARVYDASLFSDPEAEPPEETQALGESGRFDLVPHEGHVATASVYLPEARERSSQSQVVSLTVRTKCRNTI
jgi:hypothetical protein